MASIEYSGALSRLIKVNGPSILVVQEANRFILARPIKTHQSQKYSNLKNPSKNPDRQRHRYHTFKAQYLPTVIFYTDNEEDQKWSTENSLQSRSI